MLKQAGAELCQAQASYPIKYVSKVIQMKYFEWNE